LENEVSALTEKLKGYEGQIDDYIEKIDSLKKELDSKKHANEKIHPVQ
jgi:peptidoglycan hydrolase CwlO-like protein